MARIHEGGINMSRVSVEDSSVTVLLEIGGIVNLIAMDEERRDTLELMVKMMADKAYRTKRSQAELNQFLGYKG